MITPYNILRHELCGLHACVIKAANPGLSASGEIVAETRDTLTLNTQKGLKKIPKKNVTLRLELPGKTRVEVAGTLLNGRSADRLKKKIRIRY